LNIPIGIALLSATKTSSEVVLDDLLGIRNITWMKVKSEPPQELVALHFRIGSGTIFDFDNYDLRKSYTDDLNLLETIAVTQPFIIETSRSAYMTVSIVWEYNKEFIKTNETDAVEMVDETSVEIDGYSDDECLFEDSETRNVRQGRRVYFRRVKTGKKIPRDTRSLVVEPPALSIGVRDVHYDSAEERFERPRVDFWQPIGNIDHLRQEYVLRLTSEGRVRRERRLYLKNEIIFSHGRAGVHYSY